MIKYLIGLLLALAATAAGAVATLDVSVVPPSGRAPLNIVLSWNSTEVDACSKAGVSIPTNGTEAISGVTIDTTYSIVCTGGKDYSDIGWTAPTKNIDGTTIPATGPGSLAGFELYYSTNLANVDTATPIVIPANITSYRIVGQVNAVYYYKMRAVNVQGLKSDYTGAVTNTTNKVNVANMAQVDITTFSTTETVVYNVVKKTNGFIMVSVGTVALNTLCDLNQTVNGYYAVPVASVQWSGTVKPAVVVARCSEH